MGKILYMSEPTPVSKQQTNPKIAMANVLRHTLGIKVHSGSESANLWKRARAAMGGELIYKGLFPEGQSGAFSEVYLCYDLLDRPLLLDLYVYHPKYFPEGLGIQGSQPNNKFLPFQALSLQSLKACHTALVLTQPTEVTIYKWLHAQNTYNHLIFSSVHLFDSYLDRLTQI